MHSTVRSTGFLGELLPSKTLSLPPSFLPPPPLSLDFSLDPCLYCKLTSNSMAGSLSAHAIPR